MPAADSSRTVTITSEEPSTIRRSPINCCRFISLNVTIRNRSVGSSAEVRSRRRDANCNGSLPRIRISAVARVELRSE